MNVCRQKELVGNCFIFIDYSSLIIGFAKLSKTPQEATEVLFLINSFYAVHVHKAIVLHPEKFV